MYSIIAQTDNRKRDYTIETIRVFSITIKNVD
jgi:hypothetical protein